MALKDTFKGPKWYKPLGKSYHGGNAWEGKSGKAAKEAEARAKVASAKATMKNCKKCKKLGICPKHKTEAKIIQNNGK